jgi:hypothetical protein
MDITRQLNSLRPQPRKSFGVLLGMIVLSLCGGGIVGCAAEDKKPQTVTEWVRQKRVGEEYR